MVAGLKTQVVAVSGGTVQESVTVPLKPLIEFTVIRSTALVPALSVRDAGLKVIE